ncbi:MAG: hypothetical protein GY798_33630 [Hyphomicrobiales bacterium]|nr:hypothetical protein [Hyphomicrobiales bacterium]
MTMLARHITGGPLMAVVSTEGESVHCRWFADNELFEGGFSRLELIAVSFKDYPPVAGLAEVVTLNERG